MNIHPQPGFNLIGFASANLGHGVALRNTAAILHACDHPFCVLDIDPGDNRTGHDLSLKDKFISAGQPLPHPINLFHLNPPAIEALFRDLPGLVETKNHLKACVTFWELPRLPPGWGTVLETFDMVLAPTRFIQDALEAEVRSPRILHYRQSMQLPVSFSDRKRWGFAEGKTVFLFSFDVSSGFPRKNPLAVIEAFRRAFQPGKAELIIKINNRGISPVAELVVDKLKIMAGMVPGMQIIEDSLPYTDLLSLYASIDVLVSLHRSEGLGLSLMECMNCFRP